MAKGKSQIEEAATEKLLEQNMYGCNVVLQQY